MKALGSRLSWFGCCHAVPKPPAPPMQPRPVHEDVVFPPPPQVAEPLPPPPMDVAAAPPPPPPPLLLHDLPPQIRFFAEPFPFNPLMVFHEMPRRPERIDTSALARLIPDEDEATTVNRASFARLVSNPQEMTFDQLKIHLLISQHNKRVAALDLPPLVSAVCFQGHPLVSFVSSFHICDVCRLSVPRGQPLRSCRQCDFDVCLPCQEKLSAFYHSSGSLSSRLASQAPRSIRREMLRHASKQRQSMLAWSDRDRVGHDLVLRWMDHSLLSDASVLALLHADKDIVPSNTVIFTLLVATVQGKLPLPIELVRNELAEMLGSCGAWFPLLSPPPTSL